MPEGPHRSVSHQLPYNDSSCGPRKATVSKGTVFAENTEQEIPASTVVFFLFLSPPHGSEVDKVDFRNPDTQSWIRAFRNSFWAPHAPLRSVLLQTRAVYSVTNLNGGDAMESRCSCLSDATTQFLCQCIKSTYSCQVPGFILIIIPFVFLILK